MSGIKCPFCGQELEINDLDVQLLGCENQNCKHCIHYDTVGTKELWQELIHTRKALDVSVDVLKEINELLSSNKFDVKEVPLLNITQTKISMLLKYINIEQITALEQKDK